MTVMDVLWMTLISYIDNRRTDGQTDGLMDGWALPDVKSLSRLKTIRNNNDDIYEFSNPTLLLCHSFIPSRKMV